MLFRWQPEQRVSGSGRSLETGSRSTGAMLRFPAQAFCTNKRQSTLSPALLR